MTTGPPPRRPEAAWAHPPAPAMISTRARAAFEGTPSSRTARTAPWFRRAGMPRRRRSSARAGKESEETISALKDMRTRVGRVSCRKIQTTVAESVPGRATRRGAWPRTGRRGTPSRRLLDRIGRNRRAAPFAGRLGGRACRLRGRLGPLLRAFARGEGRDVVALHQGGHLLAVEDLVFQERLRDAHQGVAVLFDDLLRPVVGVQAESLDLLVDQDGGRLAVVLVLGDLAAQGDLPFLRSERQPSE